MLRPDYPITTARLLLRPFTPDDLDALNSFQSRADVARYLYWGPRSRAESAAAAVAGADVVLSINASAVAERVAVEAMPAAGAGTVWADLNTAAPDLKRRLDALATRHGLLLADVAVMAPVPPTGLRTPCLASGPGAARYAELMVQCGARVEVQRIAPNQEG